MRVRSVKKIRILSTIKRRKQIAISNDKPGWCHMDSKTLWQTILPNIRRVGASVNIEKESAYLWRNIYGAISYTP